MLFALSQQLDNTTDRLKNCTGIDHFHATWMLVVTWERVSPFARFLIGNPYVEEVFDYNQLSRQFSTLNVVDRATING